MFTVPEYHTSQTSRFDTVYDQYITSLIEFDNLQDTLREDFKTRLKQDSVGSPFLMGERIFVIEELFYLYRKVTALVTNSFVDVLSQYCVGTPNKIKPFQSEGEIKAKYPAIPNQKKKNASIDKVRKFVQKLLEGHEQRLCHECEICQDLFAIYAFKTNSLRDKRNKAFINSLVNILLN